MTLFMQLGNQATDYEVYKPSDVSFHVFCLHGSYRSTVAVLHVGRQGILYPVGHDGGEGLRNSY